MNFSVDSLSPKALLELASARTDELVREKQSIQRSNDAVKWIETNFYIPERRGPIELHPYQRAVLNLALTRKADGTFPYSTIVWSDIKKSAKSSIAAAVGLWMAFHIDWASIIVVANDLKQADSRVGLYMRRAIELNPLLRTTSKIRNYAISLPNKSMVEAVAIDPTGEAGSNADMIVFSELWGAHQDAQQRMWTEMTLSPTKYGHSFRWVETYAGYTGESPLLENLYRLGVESGRQLEVGIPGLRLFENEAARLLVLWNDTPRLPWQTPEYYAQEAAALPPHEFQRVHRNQWVSSAETFVPMEWWDACRVDELPPLKSAKQPFIIALDAAVSSDSFAIVGLTRNQNNIEVRYARRFLPPKGGKINFKQVEDEIRRLAKTYSIIEWAYDPYQLHDLATRLGRSGLGWFRPFNQNTERLVADKHLYDLIRDRRILHTGDPELRRHVENCNAEITGEEHKLRLVKKSPTHHIDLAVALSMAAQESLRLNLG